MKRTTLLVSALCFSLGAFGAFAEDKMGQDAMVKPDTHDKMGHDAMGKSDSHDKMGKADKKGSKDKMGKMDKTDKMEKQNATQ